MCLKKKQYREVSHDQYLRSQPALLSADSVSSAEAALDAVCSKRVPLTSVNSAFPQSADRILGFISRPFNQ